MGFRCSILHQSWVQISCNGLENNFNDFKGVVPHLKAIFSYFQNIYFLKVQSISDKNLFIESNNNVINQFCQIFENYLQCRFLHFSYIKSIPKLAKKVYKIQGNSL